MVMNQRSGRKIISVDPPSDPPCSYSNLSKADETKEKLLNCRWLHLEPQRLHQRCNVRNALFVAVATMLSLYFYPINLGLSSNHAQHAHDNNPISGEYGSGIHGNDGKNRFSVAASKLITAGVVEQQDSAIDIRDDGVDGLKIIDQVRPELPNQRQQLRPITGNPEAVTAADTTKSNTQSKEKEMITNIVNEENITNSFPPSCTWECYLSKNPDLSELPQTHEAALEHYLKNGKKEGRECHCGRTHWCCGLSFFENAGHALTENIADLYNCGPSIFFRKGANDSHHYSKFRQMARVVRNETKITEYREECDAYYLNNPRDHPEEGTRVYSLLAQSFGQRYDAYDAARTLRNVQEKMFDECKIAHVPKFKRINQSSRDGDDYVNDKNSSEDQFEQLIDRPPSDSVIIVVRHPMRKLLNAQNILELCQGLNLSCSLFDVYNYFSQEEKGNEFCNILNQFYRNGKNPVVVGVQGAEMFYPLFMGLRMFLVTNVQYTSKGPVDARRLGNVTMPEEVRVAHNLIRRKGNHFDPYFPEFAAMFGANLTAIHSEIDFESLERARGSGKPQCRKGEFCADLTADLVDVNSKLERLIKVGELLLRDDSIGAASKE